MDTSRQPARLPHPEILEYDWKAMKVPVDSYLCGYKDPAQR